MSFGIVLVMSYPRTLQEAVKHFSDEQVCIDAVAEMRWPDGKPACAWCGSENNYWLSVQKRWKCKACTKQFSVKRGTVFTDSPLGLDKWLVAMWMLANCRNGVSSYEIARTIGITQKSAWHMMHRIREAMTPIAPNKLGGDGTAVECDETYIGGKFRNKHARVKAKYNEYGGPSENKTMVMGAVDREAGQVRAEIIPVNNRTVMDAMVRRNVKFGSTVYTDKHFGYDGLRTRYVHETVNHIEEYVRGAVHTNGIENFWSLLKRGIGGTYISVEPEHLARYVNEQVFRYNHRRRGAVKMQDAERFKAVLRDVVMRKLTYAELTRKPQAEAF
jgi:transposase-like protein